MAIKKVLVTGGLGYIGSHTVVELMQSGYEVLIVDDLSNSNMDVAQGIEAITGSKPQIAILDVNQTEQLLQVCAEFKPDGVIHFAAYKAVGESVAFPISYYQNNISGLISLLSVMEQMSIGQLIFSSSCTVYGNASELPVNENSAIQKAESPYGTTKIICEELINDYCLHKPLKAVHLRYFNPVGAHPSSLIGELPNGVPNNLVPFITQTAAGIRKELTVFGNDYNTPDGTCIRDYIHVVDLAKAHVKALEYAEQMNKPTDMFNIGTGKGSSVAEVISAFEANTGETLHWKMGPRRAGDVEQIWADTEKANNILGWKAQLDLGQMMMDAWKWQQRLQMTS